MRPLRVGQRRLRRPRRASRPARTTAARAGLDLRRQQAGRRGADRVVRHMFDLAGSRLPLRQRRRPAPDPRRRLRLRPPAARTTRRRSRILGDGRQSKSYIHVDDVIAAVLARARERRRAFRGLQRRDRRLHHGHRDRRARRRVSLELDPATVTYEYTGGDRGWKGDVPVVRLDTERIRALGWKCRALVGVRRCGPRCARCRRRAARTDLVDGAARPSSSTATACSTRGRASTACRTRRRTARRAVALLPGVAETRAGRFADAGFALVVVTNQPDIARGPATLGRASTR